MNGCAELLNITIYILNIDLRPKFNWTSCDFIFGEIGTHKCLFVPMGFFPKIPGFNISKDHV